MTNNALPVPLPGPGVCTVCRANSTTYARCYSCNQIAKALELGTTYPVPEVLPLGLAVKKSPLALALWNYKRSTSQSERIAATAELVAFIDERLPHLMEHIGHVDTVTFVPSRKSRGNPVESLLEETEWCSSTWVEDTLEVLDTDLDTHIPDENRFNARDVSDEHVLLIDDTFTRGATSLSAARALYEAGAGKVTIVVLGRHADLDWITDDFMATVRARGERREFCPECSGHAETPSTSAADNPWEDPDDWEPPEDDWEEPDFEPFDSGTDPWAADASTDPWAAPRCDPWSEQSRTEPTPRSHQISAPAPASASGGPAERHEAPRVSPSMEPADEASESTRLSESTALTLTVILAAPFAIVFILPILLSNIGISMNPLDRYGGLWGPAGASGYITFMVFALAGGGINWALKSLPKGAAIAAFAVAAIAVAALFIGPLLNGSTSPSESAPAPTNAAEFRDRVNARAPEHGVEAITLGEAQNAIKSVCPAVAEGLTISRARSEVEYYADQQGIPDSVAQKLALMTEMVIEFSDTLC